MKLIIGLTFLIASFSSQASAEIITFEDMIAYPNNGWFSVEHGTGNFNSGSFNFSVTTLVIASIAKDGDLTCSPTCPDNGTNYFLSPYTSSLTMTKSNGGIFNFIEFDGAGGHNMNMYTSSAIPDRINVTGVRYNGEIVTQSFDIDKTNLFFDAPLNFSHFLLNDSFSNLTSITFNSSGIDSSYDVYKGFSLDNLIVAAVPEPESFAMLMAGLGLVGFLQIRKKFNS
jgi:hypothetical protein